MDLHPNGLFHIYNRGNNRERIFFRESNYRYFIRKMTKDLAPFADILAYCLMPNHFHLMIGTKEDFDRERFTTKYAIMLSSYARAVNKQENRVGSLFQQKSKAKKIFNDNYALVCFNYIHQNPVRSRLVTVIQDWEYSSIKDYLGVKRWSPTNIDLGIELLDLPRRREDVLKLSKTLLRDE